MYKDGETEVGSGDWFCAGCNKSSWKKVPFIVFARCCPIELWMPLVHEAADHFVRSRSY